ncbi:hypothetical protein ETAA8_35320 [Anatilimnocola aggregata]|uniref:Uncharacterized protein n=1 Tax=Anatilimnocola aggregata TaxID=2528021 RepID=A0A517YE48_9BACT|nr:hypothetical protein ETAA8_35320 [Anatilimnocola aggregata]
MAAGSSIDTNRLCEFRGRQTAAFNMEGIRDENPKRKSDKLSFLPIFSGDIDLSGRELANNARSRCPHPN